MHACEQVGRVGPGLGDGRDDGGRGNVHACTDAHIHAHAHMHTYQASVMVEMTEAEVTKTSTTVKTKR